MDQAEALLIVLALMRGSLKTSLLGLTRLLTVEPAKKEEEAKAGQRGRAEGEGEGLPGLIPYLKQLEDYRHHKVC